MAATNLSESRIPALDGLRGVAILLALGFHLIGSLFVRSHHHLIIRLLDLGWCGVDLFFVLSGYLIGGILLDNAGSPSYYRTFYARRAFRILPPYLILVCAMEPLRRAFGLQNTSWTVYAFVANIAYCILPGWIGMMHLWSLSAEEQFYLLLPPTIRRIPQLIPALVTAIFVISPFVRLWEFWHFGATGARFLPFGHMDGLMLGVLIAYLLRRHRALVVLIAPHLRKAAAVIGGALVCFAQLGWTDAQIQIAVFGYSLVALLFSCVLTSALIYPAKWSLLSDPALQYLGRRSYAIYLLHFPIFWILAPRMPYILSLPLTIVLTVGLAELSWRLLEAPMLQRGRKFKYASPPVVQVETLT